MHIPFFDIFVPEILTVPMEPDEDYDGALEL